LKQQISYTIQLGTAFDDSQELIWTLAREKTQATQNVIVPRPRFYRVPFAKLAAQTDTETDFAHEVGKVLHVQDAASDQDLRFVLNLTDPMQPPQAFCPDGQWFPDLGQAAAQYRRLFGDSPVTFMIGLRNPAALLSDARASGAYPEFEENAPDPFDLRWQDVLADLAAQVPRTPIVTWCAEQAPAIWRKVCETAAGATDFLSLEGETNLANRLMTAEGQERLQAYLSEHPGLPQELRARVIAIFVEKFAQTEKAETSITLPDWTVEKQLALAAQYQSDLKEIAEMDTITYLSAG
jgi:hypothetical protein